MAYAAVVSLGQTLDHIIRPDHHLIPYPRKEFVYLRIKVRFLQELLEKSPQGIEEFETLEIRIRNAVFKAEDFIETQVYLYKYLISFPVVDFVMNSYTKILAAFQIMMPFSHVFESGMGVRDRMWCWLYYFMYKLVKEIDLCLQEGNKIIESCRVEEDFEISMDYSPSRLSRLPGFVDKSVIVGADDDYSRIKDRLTGPGPQLEVVPIVGMGGIGKTTMAESICNDPLIEFHFDVRAWVTVSRVYKLRAKLIELSASLEMLNDNLFHQGEAELAEKLYKNLYGRKYLIVMDDLWSTDAWDDFKILFPDNNNGSRIILTTRLEGVAIFAAGSCSTLQRMQLLCHSDSWELLCRSVFGDESCPPRLEKIGKDIARDCRGLPLAIVVIAGILRKVNRTPDEWTNTVKNLQSVVNYDSNALFAILLFSYYHLPQPLKACFLYMGVFPEDCRISASKVIKLWASEGFIKPDSHRTLEEVAEQNLSELAERSLISVLGKGQETVGQARNRVFGIHDLLRDLCIREAQREKLFYVVKSKYVCSCPNCINYQRRLSIYPNIPVDDPFFKCLAQFDSSIYNIPPVRSLVYAGGQPIPSRKYSWFPLLRVLDITQVEFSSFPMEIVELFNLRYLAFPYHGDIPESISKLWNLETLIFYPLLKTFAPCPRPLPLAIWSMPRLRHLKFHVWYLSDFPCLPPGWKTGAFLENLQTLSEVNASFCTQEVLCEVPNLKKLGMWMETWDAAHFYICNLVCLEKLEVLKCSVRSFPRHEVHTFPNYNFPPDLAFPMGLKELSLRGCRMPWRDMTVIGSLPNLEKLKLRDYAFVGPEWEPNEGEFRQLEFLLIDGSDLVHWEADSSHFPLLRHLILDSCWKLEAIPNEIGEIPTLEIIELVNSNYSALASAKQIQEEQNDFGNQGLRVYFHRA